jgi:hypothetical protein
MLHSLKASNTTCWHSTHTSAGPSMAGSQAPQAAKLPLVWPPAVKHASDTPFTVTSSPSHAARSTTSHGSLMVSAMLHNPEVRHSEYAAHGEHVSQVAPDVAVTSDINWSTMRHGAHSSKHVVAASSTHEANFPLHCAHVSQAAPDVAVTVAVPAQILSVAPDHSHPSLVHLLQLVPLKPEQIPTGSWRHGVHSSPHDCASVEVQSSNTAAQGAQVSQVAPEVAVPRVTSVAKAKRARHGVHSTAQLDASAD